MTLADQRARTGLAWTRTLLGCTAVGVLTARAAWIAGAAPVLVAVPLLLSVAGVLVALGRARQLRVTTTVAPLRPVPAMAAVVVGLAVLAAVAVLLP